MSKPIEIQLVYKKQLSFTLQQKETLLKLESYGVNVNEFIRIAIRKELKREWKNIKENKTKSLCPF